MDFIILSLSLIISIASFGAFQINTTSNNYIENNTPKIESIDLENSSKLDVSNNTWFYFSSISSSINSSIL